MRAVLSAALALLLGACSNSTGPEGDVRVEPSKSVYPLPGNPTVRVDYTVRNTGSIPVALANCGEGVAAELQRRSGNIWVTAALMQCPALAIYAPVVLGPGDVFHGVIEVAEAGQYRLRVTLAANVGESYTSHAVSPGFAVRWPDD